LAILRLPGIYGPFRGPLAKAREGNARIKKDGHLFSRVHVDDVVRASAALLKSSSAASTDGQRDRAFLWEAGPISVINCCDSDPSPQHEVSALAYEVLGRPVPPALPFESADLSAMQRSFYDESRRMSNDKLLKLVGTLHFASYRTGLQACFDEERASSATSSLRVDFRAPLFTAVARTKWFLARIFGAATLRVALVDNGSLKPAATLSLRALAAELEVRARRASSGATSVRVEAVSARFSDRIPSRDLNGKHAEILPSWLQRVANEGRSRQQIVLLPLLIGPSDTLTKAIPAAARAQPGLNIAIAPSLVCLCPAICNLEATGAVKMAEILQGRLADISSPTLGGDNSDDASSNINILLCDHGSPIPRVTAAREAVRAELARLLARDVSSCCMERREGVEFDFNGPLLEDALHSLPMGAVAFLALLFLQEGRHAGPGGDIANIVAGVQEKRPDLTIKTTKVIAGHPLLPDVLVQRMEKAVPLRFWV